MTAYGDADYRAARAVLEAGAVPCAWRGPRCTGRATSPDHVPALAEHDHVAGSGCCVLIPSCRPCNYGRGAALSNRRRRAPGGPSTYATRGLAPGSGVL